MSNTIVDELRLLTVEELAQICGTGQDWIRQGLKARRWAFTMVGRQYRFTRSQAEAIIDAHRVDAATVPSRDELADRRYGAGRRSA